VNSLLDLQSTGNICIRVDSVTEEPTTGATSVRGTMRISGLTGSTVEATQPGNPDVTPAEVDAGQAALWIRQLVGPSRSHGFELGEAIVFTTRKVAHPPNLALASLPFFDPRTAPDSSWGGIDESGTTDSVLKSIFNHFTVTRGTNLDDSRYMDTVGPNLAASDCEGRLQTACFVGCRWDEALGCLGSNGLHFRFRDEVSDTNIFGQSSVIRDIEYTWSSLGFLSSIDELVFADPSPTTGSAPCELSGPCTSCTADTECPSGAYCHMNDVCAPEPIGVNLTPASPARPSGGEPESTASLEYDGAWDSTTPCAF